VATFSAVTVDICIWMAATIIARAHLSIGCGRA
jgi:hypothetical protein